MKRFATGVTLAAALLVGSAVAGDVTSGPKVGDNVGAFHPLNVTGKFAGQKQCLVWAYGSSPVAVVFARETSGPLTSLVKKIDAETAKNSGMRSFVTFLSDDESLEGKLKTLSTKEGIKNTPFTIDNTAGPKAYKIAKDADVTVIFYKNKKVVANHAFKKGSLTDQEIDKVVADVSKLLN